MNLLDDLTYQVALSSVTAFASSEDRLLKDHHAAMDSLDCQAFLQRGIDTFRWIRRFEETCRAAIERGVFDNEPLAFETIASLYKSWLASCDKANSWIEKVTKADYSIDNIDEYRRAEQVARSRVASDALLRASNEPLDVEEEVDFPSAPATLDLRDVPPNRSR